ncbi:hypothetical protein ACFW9F_16125 [Streptomyces sp. NPDC059506]|uniref:hypothetical protein n=1 Tax=unclassified Streptomyces TaxID=2593676 RepID=UPI0015FAB3CC|nr:MULTISPECIES: hypothetical protein [unclassified Streptomyces]MCZ2526794.1 hypothetical protein [Streptomyces sp. HB2AG]QMV22729.1 hypothetical protein GQS52_14160 [Streptomyces sp. SCUT-3]
MNSARRRQDVKAEAHRFNPALADLQKQAEARAELDACIADHLARTDSGVSPEER